MPGRDLRLLALDGGGIRGLSSLLILKQLMRQIDPDAEEPPKPCDYFDMIGGTSTGGIIAIMLGRLKMSIDECEDAYISLSERVFQRTHYLPVTLGGRLQGRFDSRALEMAIKETLRERGLPEEALLKDDPNSNCKVFVCVTNKQSSKTECLTSYTVARNVSDLVRYTKIWQACRATSAASTFFEPITIGRYNEEFVDGGTGANNPIWKLWEQAKAVWHSEPFEEEVQCIVSIGTGGANITAFNDDLRHIGDTLKHIATETEKTAEAFRRDKPQLVTAGVYYRFNVARGLDRVGLEETRSIGLIAAATRDYLDSEEVHPRIMDCARILSTRHVLGLPPSVGLNRSSSGPSSSIALNQGARDEAVRLLRGEGFQYGAQDFDTTKAIHWAAEKGHAIVIRLLLEQGVDVNAIDDRLAQTPLIQAASNGCEGVMQLLLRNNAKLEAADKYGRTALIMAVLKGQSNPARLLLEHGANVNVVWGNPPDTAFCRAVREGREELLRPLIEAGANVNFRGGKLGWTPLHWAAKNGCESVVRLLLEKGADVRATDNAGKTALHLAAANGQQMIVRSLLDRQPDIMEKRDKQGDTALHEAAWEGHEAVVQELLNRGGDINSKNTQMWATPLHHAASKGHTAVVQLLLELGADVEAVNKDSETALDLANMNQHWNVKGLLRSATGRR